MTLIDDFLSMSGKELASADDGVWQIVEVAKEMFLPRVRGVSYRGAPLKFDVTAIASEIYNAHAIIFDDNHLITINSATHSVIGGVMLAVMSHPEMFKENPSPLNPRLNIFPVSSKSDVYRVQWLECDMDVRRAKLAGQLSWASLLYIMEHEFAHLWNGHVQFVKDNGGRSELAEIEEGLLDIGSAVTRQTLEWDADIAAVGNVLREALRPDISLKEDGREHWTLPQEFGFGSLAETLKKLGAAFQLTHFIWAEFEAHKPEASRTHPPAGYRSHTAVGTMIDILSYRTGRPHEEFADAPIDGMFEAVEGWCRVTLDESHKKIIGQILEIDKAAYNLYTDEWERLHPLLDVRKLGGMIAPPRPTH